MNDQQPQQQSYGPPQQPQYSGLPVPNFVPPPQQEPREPFRWLWIILSRSWIILSILGGIGVLGYGFGAKNATHPSAVITNDSSQTFVASTTPYTFSATLAEVGQTITVNDVSCTLVSVHKLEANDYDKPKPGNQFIVVHVKLNNGSSDEKDYNPLYFHVKSGAGDITNEVFTFHYTANNRLNFGKLAPGGSVEGDITFQVPIGDHKAELTWQPNYFGNSSDYAWNLGL